MNKITTHFGNVSAIPIAEERMVSKIFASSNVNLIELAIKIINTAGNTLLIPSQKLFPISFHFIPDTIVAVTPATKNITATIIIV